TMPSQVETPCSDPIREVNTDRASTTRPSAIITRLSRGLAPANLEDISTWRTPAISGGRSMTRRSWSLSTTQPWPPNATLTVVSAGLHPSNTHHAPLALFLDDRGATLITDDRGPALYHMPATAPDLTHLLRVIPRRFPVVEGPDYVA